MDFQTAFNVSVAAIGGLGGFMLRAMWEALRDLQKADTSLSESVHRIETLVAGNYIKREEVESKIDAIFRKLDRIEQKMDAKADKLHGQ